MTLTADLPEGDWRIAAYGGTAIVGTDRRRRPRVQDQERLLGLQGNTCLYCQLPIGIEVLRRSKMVRLGRNWDHFVPYSFAARNPGANWVIACHVCNGIKSGRMFTTVEDARRFILPLRESAGYEPTWSVLRRVNLRDFDRLAATARVTPATGQIWANRGRAQDGRVVRIVEVSAHRVHYTLVAGATNAARNRLRGEPGDCLKMHWHQRYSYIESAASAEPLPTPWQQACADRDRDVFALFGQGRTRTQIARHLKVSIALVDESLRRLRKSQETVALAAVQLGYFEAPKVEADDE